MYNISKCAYKQRVKRLNHPQQILVLQIIEVEQLSVCSCLVTLCYCASVLFVRYNYSTIVPIRLALKEGAHLVPT